MFDETSAQSKTGRPVQARQVLPILIAIKYLARGGHCRTERFQNGCHGQEKDTVAPS